MAPAQPSSARMRAGADNCQEVETPRTIINAQKVPQKKTKNTRIHQEMGRHMSR